MGSGTHFSQHCDWFNKALWTWTWTWTRHMVARFFYLLGIPAPIYPSSITSFASPRFRPLSTCTLFLLCRFPSISLSVCLIAGDGYVVYLTQNRTPLLFQRVEPTSSTQDGDPGLNNALPPPETTNTVNSLWVGCCWQVTGGAFLKAH